MDKAKIIEQYLKNPEMKLLLAKLILKDISKNTALNRIRQEWGIPEDSPVYMRRYTVVDRKDKE